MEELVFYLSNWKKEQKKNKKTKKQGQMNPNDPKALEIFAEMFEKMLPQTNIDNERILYNDLNLIIAKQNNIFHTVLYVYFV